MKKKQYEYITSYRDFRGWEVVKIRRILFHTSRERALTFEEHTLFYVLDRFLDAWKCSWCCQSDVESFFEEDDRYCGNIVIALLNSLPNRTEEEMLELQNLLQAQIQIPPDDYGRNLNFSNSLPSYDDIKASNAEVLKFLEKMI